jgi:CRP-like cAMP-binding protein
MALEQSIDRRVHVVGARKTLFGPGDIPKSVHLICAGIACRYNLLPGAGRRQITAFLLPGDLFALRACLGAPFDHHIHSLTTLETRALELPATPMFTEQTSGLAEALSRAMALQCAISREWVFNVGQRNAMERIAHLLCELFTRLQVVGLASNDRCLLPLTQIDLADALALTPVHVNRTLISMTRRGWLTFRRGVLTIHDWKLLTKIGGFDAGYLQSEQHTHALAPGARAHVTRKPEAPFAYRGKAAALDRQLLELRGAHDRISTEVGLSRSETRKFRA